LLSITINNQLGRKNEIQTEIGRFNIRPDPEDPGQVLLGIDNIAIGKFQFIRPVIAK